jgi:hypothetical protein
MAGAKPELRSSGVTAAWLLPGGFSTVGDLRAVIFLSNPRPHPQHLSSMIRKLKSGEYRLYSRKKDSKTGKKKNLGTFSSLAVAKKHERAVQYFKRA